MKRVLVLCTGNSCRSQMAEGYIRHFAGDRLDVVSAGLEAHGVNPRAVLVMREDSIDISRHTSKRIEAVEGQQFDAVITVCDNAKERCPYYPGALQVHRDFPDPAKASGSEEEIQAAFRSTRNQIREFVLDWLNQGNP